jgi:hypothetical protein
MEAEPPKGKRRWFQFRLRTLVIVVTLLTVRCAYVGWQAKIVRERKAMLEAGDDRPVFSATLDENKDGAIPMIRLRFGDHFCRMIILKHSADINLYMAAFPEADVEIPAPPAPL